MSENNTPNEFEAVAVDYDPFAGESLSKVYASTEAQREIWSSIQMDNEATCAFNESISLEMTGKLEIDALEAALNQLVARHESLRLTFTSDGTSLCVSESLHIQLPLINLPWQTVIEQEAKTSFDLENGPLLRCVLVEQGPQHYFLVFTAHHIICDGWSLAILVKDLGALYSAQVNNADAELEPAFAFHQYAEDELSRPSDEKYWLEKFSKSIPQYDLPSDKPRPANRSFQSRRLDIAIDVALIAQVKNSANRLGCSLSAYMLSAYFVCLSRWTGESLLAVGIPTAGQPLIAPETLVGHCVNMLPILSEVDTDQRFSDFCNAISEEVLSVCVHQNYTFGSLVKKLALRRDPSRIPLLSVLFNVDQGIQGNTLNYEGLQLEFHSNPRFYENFEVFINASDYGDRFIFECQYNTEIFEEASVRARIEEYSYLLKQLVTSVDLPIRELSLIPQEKLPSVLAQAEGPNMTWPASAQFSKLLLSQASLMNGKTAVSCGDASLSYNALHKLSNQFAHFLLNEGVQVGELIGLCMDRSCDMLVALLGILKAGAAYVPLDPDFPKDRLIYMIEDSGMRHLVYNREYLSSLSTVAHNYCYEDISSQLQQQSTQEVFVDVEESSPAYVIYTSGSTGKPKGVQVPCSAVVNFLRSMAVRPGVNDKDVLLAVTTLSFDIAVLELYLPLITGGQIVIARKEESTDGRRLLTIIQEQQVTIMQATPATWRLLLAAGWQGNPKIKALCGGEALPKDLAANLLPFCDSLWNMYGPTETTVWSTCCQVSLQDTQSALPLSIGKPIANTQLYVVDEGFHQQPLGIAGELLIGGGGLASGYLGRDELTQERFIDFPKTLGEGKGKLYRTGDKVRFRLDGQLEYLGRLDQQVKVRGFRIELGEIESLMRGHSDIKDCALSVYEKRAGDTRLVAFVVWQNQALSLETLRKFLSAQLPNYMLPQHLETLSELPRTLNGKLDRKTLASLDIQANASEARELVEPKNDTEQSLLKIWQEVLHTKLIGTEDNFFDLGGHSLLIAQIIQQVEAQMDVRLQFRDLYTSPTITELASLVSGSNALNASEKVEIQALPENEDSVLSLAQQRLWYLNKINDSSTLFNLPSAFRLVGSLNREALQKALDQLVARHKIMRSRVIEKDDVPYLHAQAPFQVDIETLDLSEVDEGRREEELYKSLQKLYSTIIEFDAFPLFKVALIQLQAQEHVLFFMPHHLIFDGWSFDIVIHELTQGYAEFSGFSADELPELIIQYGDYAHWMREWLSGHELERQVNFWKEKLAGSPPVLEMPLDYPRPDIESSEGEEILFTLHEELVNRLSRFALEQDASLFMVMTAAYLVLLNKYTGQEDIVVGAPMADRTRPGTQNLIGFFVNALPIRVQFSRRNSFLQLLKIVKESCLEAFNHQDAPFEKLVEVLHPIRDLSRAPIFQTSVTYQDISRRETAMGDLEFKQVEIPSHDSPLDLNIWFKRRGASMQAALVYTKAIFKEDTIQQMSKYFVRVLEEVMANWHQPLNGLQLLTANQQSDVLRLACGNDVPMSTETLSAFLMQAAEDKSTKSAVWSGEQNLSYADLNKQSNQFARYLKSAGVKTGDRVGICMSRSCDLLVALLGIFKTGAAYVPLDPDFPDDRLGYMVEDSSLNTLVCEQSLKPRLPQVSNIICLDQLSEQISQEPETPLEDEAKHSDPAYVIYTSGSTGKPKGVVVPRGAVINFLTSMAKKPGLSANDSLLAVTTLSFDISVLELFLPLSVGAEVVIAKREDAIDGRRLLKLLEERGVTVMQATPATWRLLLSVGWQKSGLKALCGGEALPKDLAQQLLKQCESLWNMYGPTETTVWSSCAQVTLEDTQSTQPLSIGSPIDNTQFYVVDEQLSILPAGIPGELLIGGEGLTLGYHNRQELTAEKFIERPSSMSGYPGKLYRTGDKVRLTQDGRLEYLGRLDQQVKVRGFRIELGEIETVMRLHDSIVDCALTVKEERAGDTRLVAFVVWEGHPLTLTELRKYLKDLLPAYMIPQHLEALTELPRTLNGKLDRKALASLSTKQQVQRQQIPPQTDVEKRLAELWIEITGAKSISRHDNFFDIGGHSLLSMQVIHKIEQDWGVALKPRVMLIEDLQQIAQQIESVLSQNGPKTHDAKPIKKEKGRSFFGLFRSNK